MEGRTSDWRPGPTVCRCCLTEGCYKDISTEYFWMGKREVYAEMLSETLNLSIAYSKSGGPNSNSRLICEPCIARLRDASEFKRQVIDCEKTFMNHLDPGSSSKSRDLTADPVPEVKVEMVKREKESFSDDDFDDRPDFLDVDSDDDLDDQPLTKLASKIPKKESVDLLELLDNSQITVKRKSTLKLKETPKKIMKKKEVAPKASASKSVPAKQADKKKEKSVSSIWQLTVAERNNAAIFIQHTTVRPFIFMGSSFKCFYCLQYISEIPSLLEHTSTHTIENTTKILEKYIPKGKRTLQADVSKLRCRLCNENFFNLDSIRRHLKTEHGTKFYAVSNGITEYNMELVNNMFVCHLCYEKFHTFSLLNSHMNYHVGKVVCENCGAGFLNQHLLMKHKESHLYNPFTCKLCDRYFYKKSQLKYHTAIVHKGKDRARPSKCPQCPKTFKEHYSKMSHLKEEHGINRTFDCHICKSSFGMRRALTEHISKYHTEKYKCVVCSKCYGTEYRLKQHMKGHIGEKNFICEVCKNAYMHKITLKKHMRSHGTFTSKNDDCILIPSQF